MKRAIFLLILIISCSKQDYCRNYSNGKDSNRKIDAYMNKISQEKIFASQADSVLSKLIVAKSPVVTNWVARRGLNTQSQENEIVIQWRRYYFENFIIKKYPTLTTESQKKIEEFYKDINEFIFTKDNKKRLQRIFSESKDIALKRIRQSKIRDEIKTIVLNRIEKIELYWFSKIKGTKYERIPLEFLSWGIAYDPIPNQINLGVQSLCYQDDATLFAVFAHEIGHSIDPCRWGAFFRQPNPFQEVIDCLRREDSAHAQNRDDSLLDKLVSMKKIPVALAQSLKDNPTCNKTFYPLPGYQKDQILETFADWFAAEVVALSEYLRPTLRKDLCQKSELMKGSSYITNEARLKRIYFAHPVIQKRLNVKSDASYCSWGA